MLSGHRGGGTILPRTLCPALRVPLPVLVCCFFNCLQDTLCACTCALLVRLLTQFPWKVTTLFHSVLHRRRHVPARIYPCWCQAQAAKLSSGGAAHPGAEWFLLLPALQQQPCGPPLLPPLRPPPAATPAAPAAGAQGTSGTAPRAGLLGAQAAAAPAAPAAAEAPLPGWVVGGGAPRVPLPEACC